MFEWDHDNVEHIAWHHVTPEEVEEAFADRYRFGVAAYSTPTERRSGFVGATDVGRVLFVVYTRRGSALRVIHARDADTDYRRLQAPELSHVDTSEEIDPGGARGHPPIHL